MGFIKLNKQAFYNNLDYYSHLLGGIDKVCIVLKDNAYGHGLEEISNLSYLYGVQHCMVRNLQEASIVSQYNFHTILILYDKPANNTYPSNYIFAVNSIENLKTYPSGTCIELKFDSGMSRNGIQFNQLDEAIDIIKQKQLKLYGVFTHFCCADENNDKTISQESLFLDCVEQIKQIIPYNFRIHCANSAAVHKIDNNKYDIARIGIGIYGYCTLAKNKLQPVLSLWGERISTRVLNSNDCIGYGATYHVESDNFIVSNYDIGYGDGLFRVDETQKVFLPNKKQILGRISMDSFSIQGKEECVCVFDDANYLAKIHNTVNYEILTHLSSYIKRYIKENI